MATRGHRTPSAPIALLTDYGGGGPYVAALKAVILSINLSANIFDITHDIAAQAVEEGAFTLAQVLPFLPSGTICVAVVDPGVGTERRAIVMRNARAIFVGPDNGLLSAMLDDSDRPSASATGTVAIDVPANCQAVELCNPSYFRQPVSATFQGRDIFAPVAAHLSLGIPLDVFGSTLTGIQVFPVWRATKKADGSYDGRVLSVDRFGNLITDIRAAGLPSRNQTRIRTEIAGVQLDGLQRTFQGGPDLIVYAGSSGFLEIGRRNGSAAAALGAGAGEPVRVSRIASDDAE